MAQRKPSKKKLKLVSRVVGEDPSLATGAALFLYPWDRLEHLAANLNDVAPDSPHRFVVDLVERLLAHPPAKQEWVKRKDLAPIIGPTPCTPAPGSPLYGLNKFLEMNPCFLRIEGFERANGEIGIHATHIPIPFGMLIGDERLTLGHSQDRILWLLWEVLDRNVDLARLKRCPVCNRWFVDHTKRGNKTHCMTRCTTRRWSWEARKKAGHRLRGVKGYKPRPRKKT